MGSKHARWKYAHMLPKDKEIWDRFLEQYGDYFDYFEYDVHVGEGLDWKAARTPEMWKMAHLLSQKRIDAVGHRGDEVWLFEIKPRAGLSGIGQLKGYKILWEYDFRPRKVYRLVLVTNKASYDIPRICESEGIVLREVG